LKKKDCVLAKSCWEKYKTAFAQEFMKNPQAGKAIDDVISKREAPPSSKEQKESEITKRNLAAGGAWRYAGRAPAENLQLAMGQRPGLD
jgi:hypothetical protein